MDVDLTPAPGWDHEPPDGPPDAEDAPLPLFADVAAFLDGGLPEPPPRTVCARDDGQCAFYDARPHIVFGDPESGKTMFCLASMADVLDAGGRAAFVDLDHNGLDAIVAHLLGFGAPIEALRDPDRFRYAEPEDATHLLMIVRALAEWEPQFVVIDSVGELLPMIGKESNSGDDFTKAHRAVMKPLASAGAAVVAIDHLGKDTEVRKLGPSGTFAKRRAVPVLLRVTLVEQFIPGKGGRARVTILKDRHGELRKVCPPATGRNEPTFGEFVINDAGRWSLTDPTGEAQPTTSEFRPTAIMEAISRLLETAGEPLSFRRIKEGAPGKHDAKPAAIAALVADDYINTAPGPRGSVMHELVRPYRQADDPRSDRYSGGATVTGPSDRDRGPVPIGRGTVATVVTVAGATVGATVGPQSNSDAGRQSDSPQAQPLPLDPEPASGPPKAGPHADLSGPNPSHRRSTAEPIPSTSTANPSPAHPDAVPITQPRACKKCGGPNHPDRHAADLVCLGCKSAEDAYTAALAALDAEEVPA